MGILPELSNFYCHPGRAGGLPNVITRPINSSRRWTPACDRIAAKEIATELTESRRLNEQQIKVALDRNQLAREVERFLKGLPQVEEADISALLDILGKRLQPELRDYFSHWPENSQPDESQFRRALPS